MLYLTILIGTCCILSLIGLFIVAVIWTVHLAMRARREWVSLVVLGSVIPILITTFVYVVVRLRIWMYQDVVREMLGLPL